MVNPGPMMNGVTWALTIFSAAFSGLRVYCKISLHRGLWWDDYVLIFAWICLFIVSCFLTRSIHLGIGSSQVPDNPGTMNTIHIDTVVMNTLINLATVLSKTSFGITLLRITQGRLKGVILALTILMNIFVLLSILFQFLRCEPENTSWIKGDGCWSVRTYINSGIFVGSFSAFVDFTFAIIPWFLLMNLQMLWKEKLGVAIAMSFGAVAGVMAIMRCVNLPKIESGVFSRDAATLFMWYIAESATTIVAASIPVLRGLIKELRSSVDRYTHGTKIEAGLTPAVPNVKHSSHVISSTLNMGRSTTVNPDSDAGSDRSILEPVPGKDGIVRTHEIRLSYHDKSDNDDMGYEMYDIHGGLR